MDTSFYVIADILVQLPVLCLVGLQNPSLYQNTSQHDNLRSVSIPCPFTMAWKAYSVAAASHSDSWNRTCSSRENPNPLPNLADITTRPQQTYLSSTWARYNCDNGYAEGMAWPRLGYAIVVMTTLCNVPHPHYQSTLRTGVWG